MSVEEKEVLSTDEVLNVIEVLIGILESEVKYELKIKAEEKIEKYLDKL